MQMVVRLSDEDRARLVVVTETLERIVIAVTTISQVVSELGADTEKTSKALERISDDLRLFTAAARQEVALEERARQVGA